MPSADRRAARLEQGLCATCGTEPVVSGKTKGEACAQSAREQAAKRREKAAAKGLCEACMKRKAAEGRGRRCRKCADKYLAAQLARAKAKRANV